MELQGQGSLQLRQLLAGRLGERLRRTSSLLHRLQSGDNWQLWRFVDPNYDPDYRCWAAGLVVAAAGVVCILLGTMLLVPAGTQILTHNSYQYYGLATFLLVLGFTLSLVALNGLLLVPWCSVLPAVCYNCWTAVKHKARPGLDPRDDPIWECIVGLSVLAVVMSVLGVIIAVPVPPYTHPGDTWVAIVFLVSASVLLMWVCMLHIVLQKSLKGAYTDQCLSNINSGHHGHDVARVGWDHSMGLKASRPVGAGLQPIFELA